MTEQFARTNGIDLCYEVFGDPRDPTVLVGVGLGAQLVAVPEGFCEMLVENGFCVVRFDNRDAGRSTIFDASKPPSAWQLLRRDPQALAYTLDDMADDVIGLLDALSIETAHLVGASMGGMIAQIATVRYPDRVSSLISMMSSTGALFKGRPALRFLRYVVSPPPSTAEQAIARQVAIARARGSTDFADDAHVWHVATLSHSRNSDRSGSRRQLAAMLAARDRTAKLATIRVPTLVIHGTADRFVHPSGGRATAAAIPGAHLQLVEGMGHDLPPATWPAIVAGIVGNAARTMPATDYV